MIFPLRDSCDFFHRYSFSAFHNHFVMDMAADEVVSEVMHGIRIHRFEACGTDGIAKIGFVYLSSHEILLKHYSFEIWQYRLYS